MIRPYYTLNLFNFTAAGFGLRVVGGKTGTDGRTFAYVMWTLPDGPAAKVGIQRGDKVRSRPNFFLLLRATFAKLLRKLVRKLIVTSRLSSREIYFPFYSIRRVHSLENRNRRFDCLDRAFGSWK